MDHHRLLWCRFGTFGKCGDVWKVGSQTKRENRQDDIAGWSSHGGFGDAVAEYERLVQAYNELDYGVVILPNMKVGERADIVLACPD